MAQGLWRESITMRMLPRLRRETQEMCISSLSTTNGPSFVRMAGFWIPARRSRCAMSASGSSSTCWLPTALCGWDVGRVSEGMAKGWWCWRPWGGNAVVQTRPPRTLHVPDKATNLMSAGRLMKMGCRVGVYGQYLQ